MIESRCISGSCLVRMNIRPYRNYSSRVQLCTDLIDSMERTENEIITEDKNSKAQKILPTNVQNLTVL